MQADSVEISWLAGFSLFGSLDVYAFRGDVDNEIAAASTIGWSND